jgi:D-glycero-D-manno-heptose 1,7-bisphosphate phosphatase
VVSNQQGVAKGFIRNETIDDIHRKMLAVIREAGGEIHSVYYSPYLENENHRWRKPNPGMAWQAQKDFPQIDFLKSFMIGDAESDMVFGRNLGMVNVLISGDMDRVEMSRDLYDFIFPDLMSFRMVLEKTIFGNR